MILQFTMKKNNLFFLFLIISFQLQAQEMQWAHYLNVIPVNKQIIDGDYIWGATNYGLIRLNTLSGDVLLTNASAAGAPYASYNDIAVDSLGFKWMSTSSGLVKYNGQEWTVYNPSNSGLISSSVKAIDIDKNNTVWVAFIYGISSYDGKKWKYVYNDPSSGLIEGATPSAIKADHKGIKWVLFRDSKGAGLSRYNDTSWTVFRLSDFGLKSADGDFKFLHLDREGNKWIALGTDMVLKFGYNDFTVINASNLGLSNYKINSISEDNLGNKWFVSDKRMAKYDGKTAVSYSPEILSVPFNSINNLTFDRHNNAWFTTDLGYEVKFDGKNYQLFYTANSGMPSGWVKALAVDAKDKKWIGTFDQGLCTFDGINWTIMNPYNSGNPSMVLNSITIDSKGVKWIGTPFLGVIKYNDTVWTSYNSNITHLPSDFINCISIDPAGIKWVGSSNGGLFKFDDKTWTVYNTGNSGIKSNFVQAIEFDKQGRKWIVVSEDNYYSPSPTGLLCYNDTTWTDYTNRVPGISPLKPYKIIKDRSGILWFMTYSDLIKFDGSTWTYYKMSDYMVSYNHLLSIMPDSSGNIWITAAYNEGIYKFDGKKCVYFPAPPYNRTGYGISTSVMAMDSRGGIWMNNPYGISVFRESGISDVANDKNEIAYPREYSLSQNYPNPFNPVTTISYTLKNESDVKLKVYNLLGKEVALLVNDIKPSGNYSIKFDASFLPSGVYIYTIQAGQFRDSKKLVLLK